MTKIEVVWKGLQILSKYSDNIRNEHFYLIAGPEFNKKVSTEDYLALLAMGWSNNEGVGFEISL